MNKTTSLDPVNWDEFREQAHGMLDDIIDYLEQVRERPVWRPIPDAIREHFREALPLGPAAISSVHETFMHDVLPYAVGNIHPGFMGWVHGGGTPVGMLAEMLAAGMNANLGGRDHMPIEVEKQISIWMRELFGFPETSSGLFVTGTSMANFIALLVARYAFLGSNVRKNGVHEHRLAAYTSESAHGSVVRAFDFAGIGTDTLRQIPVNENFEMDVEALASAVKKDRESGLRPFFVSATAGTVDTGAIDDLAAIADCARREDLWFHVDGAFGALAMLAPEIAPRLSGIDRADSIAFDFHKWGQVPYDAGFILVRDGELHRKTFASAASYLRRENRALAAGSPWPCDFGLDLSRGFRALKTWYTIKVFGAEKLGQVISETCKLALYLKSRIMEQPQLELLAPVSLNIVCFRYRCAESDRVNAEIVVKLQESGVAAPSTTLIKGMLAIRAAIVNHRTGKSNIDALIDAVLAYGESMTYEHA